MPKIKVAEVTSFSSEDPNHPAENLLSPDTFRIWKCAPSITGKQCVSLRLEKLTQIRSVDIGNYGSAFVELLVGRENSEDMQVLLINSSFMSPLESRNASDMTRVRMFTTDKLAKNVRDQKWDKVKVVCHQPFNKNIQFGLSFITFNSPDDLPVKESNSPPRIFGKFKLLDDEPSSLAVGSLFKKQKTGDALSSASPSSIRIAGNQVATSSAASKLTRDEQGKGTADVGFYQLKKKAPVVSQPSPSHKAPKEPDKASDKRNKAQETGRSDDKKQSSDRIEKDRGRAKKAPDATTSGGSVKWEKRRKSCPFSQLMKGVVFAMSGYQNPQRSDFRDKMLAMGAKYRRDWDSSCTHLICAFSNTPKYQQVKGKGKIVTASWIEDCSRDMIRYPWRKYQLECKADESESEEEIWADEKLSALNKTSEDSPLPDANAGDDAEPDDTKSIDSVDTDEEIRRVLAKEEGKKGSRDADESSAKEASRGSMFNGLNDTDDDVYDQDTDVEEEQDKKELRKDTSGLPLPQLGNYLEGKKFFIFGNMHDDLRRLLERYITAFNGEILQYMDKEVDFIITEEDWDENFDDALNENSTVQFVRPQWIWQISNKRKCVPHQPFLVVPKE